MFTAVQAGLTLAVKRYRGVDDIQTNMIGMFGAGASLSLTTNIFGNQPASGQVKPTTPSAYAIDAVRTGALFAALNGAFMKLGQRFGGKTPPKMFITTILFGMLASLVSRNMKKISGRGQLMDDCLSLLSDSALREIKIPPGPRLKILNYVAASKANVTAHQGIGDFGVQRRRSHGRDHDVLLTRKKANNDLITRRSIVCGPLEVTTHLTQIIL